MSTDMQPYVGIFKYVPRYYSYFFLLPAYQHSGEKWHSTDALTVSLGESELLMEKKDSSKKAGQPTQAENILPALFI